jgi:hypothetical protein
VAWGRDPFSGRLRVARGVVAVGPVALGAVAVGPVAVGAVAVGLLAVAAVFAVGQLAAAAVAVGQAVAGAWLALGQAAAAARAFGAWTVDGPRALLPVAAAWLGAAAVLTVVWFRGGQRIARLGAAPSPLGFAPGGATLVAGRILPLRTLEAPISGRPCVAYDVRRLRAHRPTRIERGGEDFVIDDGTGRARVLVADAVLLLEPLRHLHQAVEQRVVVAAGGERRGGVARPVGTAVERVLLPGDRVTVAGQRLGLTGGGASVLCAGAAGPVLVTNRRLDELRAEVGVALWLAAPFATAALGSLLMAFS